MPGEPFLSTVPYVSRAFLRQMRQIIMIHGQKGLWLSKTKKRKHEACWDDVLEQPDPDCSVCGGSGYNFKRKPLSMFINMEKPHGFQGGAGSLHTTGGKTERVDADAWITADVGDDILKDDLIIFPYDSRQSKIEFTVITKIPYHIFGNRPFLYRLMLFKSIRDEDSGNPTIK